MPLRRSAMTVKFAVHSINWGIRNSPMGTAKNRKPSGKMIRRATDMPSTAGTAKTSNATNASWVTALTATKSPNNQENAAPAIITDAPSIGFGVSPAMTWRCRHTSHNTIGGTRKPWVKVSDRAQIVTMAVPVSRYRNKVQAKSRINAVKA